MTWNLVNEIDGKGYTGFSDREIDVIREIKREYDKSMDWFTRSDNETDHELAEMFWAYSKEHDIKAKGMLLTFNMLQEHIKLSMQDILFGEIVECESGVDASEPLKENHYEITPLWEPQFNPKQRMNY